MINLKCDDNSSRLPSTVTGVTGFPVTAKNSLTSQGDGCDGFSPHGCLFLGVTGDGFFPVPSPIRAHIRLPYGAVVTLVTRRLAT
jgi:hypothetical protein